MSGGILQLVVKGIETLYLTDNPQITQFKIVYRRHTNFSTFDLNLRFKNKLDFGGRTTYKLRNAGDIMYNLALVADLPRIDLKFDDATVDNVKGLLATYGVSWSSSSSDLVTLDDYETDIINSVNTTLTTLTDNYDKNNNLLCDFDVNYTKGADVYSGTHYMLDHTIITADKLAVDLSATGLSLSNRDVDSIDDVYIFINADEFNVEGSTITLTPDDDIAVDGEYRYVTADYLKNFTSAPAGTKYAAVKFSALGNDLSSEQTITLTGNIYENSHEINRFKYAASDQIVRDVLYANIYTDSNDNMQLFDDNADEFNSVYLLYNADGLDLSGGSLSVDLDSANVLKNGDGDVIYCSEKYLDKYRTDNGESGTYIAINRDDFLGTEDTVLTIDLTTHGYINTSDVTYTNFPSDTLTDSESMYVLMSNSGVTDTTTSIHIPMTNASSTNDSADLIDRSIKIVSQTTLEEDSNNNITTDDTDLKTYTFESNDGDSFDFIERVDPAEATLSSYDSTHQYVLIDKDEVTVNLDDTITFPKTAIYRGVVKTRLNRYTDSVTRTNIVLDNATALTDKYGSNALSYVTISVKNSSDETVSVTNPYFFTVNAFSDMFSEDSSDEVERTLYRGLLALFNDMIADTTRNIYASDLSDIRKTMYTKFIDAILNVQVAYGDLLMSYSGDGITDGDTVSYTNPTTGVTSDKTVVVSDSRENIIFYHVIDMYNYNNIPIRTDILRNYFDYTISSSYSDASAYESLDAYVIYNNFMTEFTESGNNFLPTIGYYDSVTLSNIAASITRSISTNFLSNTEILYQIFQLLDKIRVDSTDLSSTAIHTAVVYTNTSISIDGSNQITYAAIEPNNDSRYQINIIDEMLRVAANTDSTVFFKENIEGFMDTFIDSIRTNASNVLFRPYFNKLLYWNECLLESQLDYVANTSMKNTLSITTSVDTYGYYNSVFGGKRAILSHIPYALVQNIPYAIGRIIIEGGLFDINSAIFAFPDIDSESDKTRFIEVLTDYMALELYDTNFVETYKDGDNADVNKRTVIEDLEEDMFLMVVGGDREDTTTYYNATYINSLQSIDDSGKTKYIISPFMIEPIGELAEDTDLGFSAESDLTALEYVTRKFKRIYKRILTDFVAFLNGGHFTDSLGATQTVSDLTGGDASSVDFTFVEGVYTQICSIIDTYMTTTIISEPIYSNTFSLYTDTQVFKNIRITPVSLSHNYRLLDIQSSIWNIIQKQNIRAFNVLLSDGILALSSLRAVGGGHLLDYYDQLIDVIENASGAPTIYTDEYTDNSGNVKSANYNTDYDDLSPIGSTGIDFYRLRLDDGYATVKDKISSEISYFNYLLNERYNRLNKILNVRYVSLFQRNYMYNSSEEIIKELSLKLIDDNDISDDEYGSDMISIIGYDSDTDFSAITGVAAEVYASALTPIDLIKSGGTYRDGDDGNANSGDNIYNLLYQVYDAVSNPYDSSNPGLQDWYDTYSGSVDMNDVFDHYNTLINGIYPYDLFLHGNKNLYFNSYNNYSGGILFMMDRLLKNTSTVSDLYSSLSLSYDGTVDIYDDIVSILSTLIETDGDKIFKIATFEDGTTDYKQTDTVVDGLVTKIYRYQVFTTDDLTVDGSEMDTALRSMLSGEKPKFQYVKELGHRLVESVSISFDSQEIEMHDSDILSHIANVRTTEEHRSGYNTLIGNTTAMQTYDSEQKPITRLYIPFRFWCCKGEVSSGLFMINLLHTDVFFKIKLRSLDELIIKDVGSVFTHRPRLRTHLLASFVYLEEEERLRIARSRLEFLMTRYYRSEPVTLTRHNIYDDNKVRMMMNFNDPSKYIFWKMRFEKPGIEPDKFDWIVGELKNPDNEEYYLRSMDQCKLKFNGRTRENYKDYNYWNVYQPYTRGIYDLRPGEFVYSFANRPLEFQPTGQANLTNIDDVTLIMKLHPKAIDALNDGYVITIYSWSYAINIVVNISGIGGLRFYF